MVRRWVHVVGVPLTTARSLYASEEALWKVTAAAIKRYTVALPRAASYVVGPNGDAVMLYGSAGGGVLAQGASGWSLGQTAKQLWSGTLPVGTFAQANVDGVVYTDDALEVNGTTKTVLPSLVVNGLTGKSVPVGTKGMLFFPWYLGARVALGLYIAAGASKGSVVVISPTGKVVCTLVQRVTGGLNAERARVFITKAGVHLWSPAIGSRQIVLPSNCLTKAVGPGLSPARGRRPRCLRFPSVDSSPGSERRG
jgi:hypothetical protein